MQSETTVEPKRVPYNLFVVDAMKIAITSLVAK